MIITRKGNTLETVDNQKKRAIEAKKLIKYFNEFNKYTPDEFKKVILPNIMDKNAPKKFKYKIFTKPNKTAAAKKIQQLNLIIKDLSKVDRCSNVSCLYELEVYG